MQNDLTKRTVSSAHNNWRAKRAPTYCVVHIAVATYRNALRDSKYTTPKFHTVSLARILAALDRSRSPKVLAILIDE